MLIEILIAIFGVFYFLFLPGYLAQLIISQNKNIGFYEKIGLSFGLSVAIVPLTIFYMSRIFYMRLNLTTCIMITSVILILEFFIYVSVKAGLDNSP